MNPICDQTVGYACGYVGYAPLYAGQRYMQGNRKRYIQIEIFIIENV